MQYIISADALSVYRNIIKLDLTKKLLKIGRVNTSIVSLLCEIIKYIINKLMHV